MAENETNITEDHEMADYYTEKVVTMIDVLQEEQDFEDDANAVLGASDEKNCTYSKGYIKRQAIYACLTCCSEAKDDPTKRAGVCLACSLNCHENHELVELYTKRNFRCDCGNPKFNSHPCQFTTDKNDLNEENEYNQNFSGLYCNCHRPYPDPEAANEDEEMIQCIICEDWLHVSHLDAVVPGSEQYSEMVCKACMKQNEFLHSYSSLAVNIETGDVDITTVSGNNIKISNGDLENDKLINGKGDKDITEKSVNDMDVDEEQTKDKSSTISGDTEVNQSEKSDDKEETNIISEISTKTAKETFESQEPENKETVQNALAGHMITEKSQDFDDKEDAIFCKLYVLQKTSVKIPKNSEQSKSKATIEEAENSIIEKTEQHITDTSKSEETSDTIAKDLKATEAIDQMSEMTSENNNGDEQDKLDSNDSNSKKENSNQSCTDNTLDNEDKDKTTTINDVGVQDNKTSQNTTDNDNNSDASKTTDAEKDSNPNSTEIEMTDVNKDTTIENFDKTSDQNEKNITDINADTSEEPNKPCDEGTKEPETQQNLDTDTLSNEKEDNKDNKRKFLTDGPVDTSPKKVKLDIEKPCSRPKGGKQVHKGATFWPSNFRQKLCTCSNCLSMYKDLSVLFLIDPEDTVFAYETLGKERVDGRITQYEKGLQALSSLDRVHQINALTEYNKMKDKLLDYLKSFKDRKEVVKEEDIKAFFAGMKPKREPDGVYFCR